MKIKFLAVLMTLAVQMMTTYGVMPPQAKLTRQRHKEMMKGPIPSDMIMRPSKGKLVLINMQKDIPEEKLAGRGRILEETLCTLMKVESEMDSFSLATAESLMNKHQANVAFFLIEDKSLPMSLTCLEGAWGMINMAKLKEGNVEQSVLVKRFAVEFNRVIRSLLNVGENGGRPTSGSSTVRQAPRKASDLDQIKQSGIPMDAAIGIHGNMRSFGIEKARLFFYEEACENGWAPAPTNDIQKAIWERVHAMPTEPIKIKPEAKKIAK